MTPRLWALFLPSRGVFACPPPGDRSGEAPESRGVLSAVHPKAGPCRGRDAEVASEYVVSPVPEGHPHG